MMNVMTWFVRYFPNFKTLSVCKYLQYDNMYFHLQFNAIVHICIIYPKHKVKIQT